MSITTTISVNKFDVNSFEKCLSKEPAEDNERSLKIREKNKNYFGAPLIWTNIIAIFVVHVLSVYALIFFPYISSWKTLIFYLFIGSLGGFGVTAGAHRYWTHRSYKAKLPLQIILLVCYLTAGQNSLYNWVRDHRVHHKYSETDADPHNSNRGFFFAHVGWLMMKKHPKVIENGNKLDFTDIERDPLVAFQERHFLLLKTIFCFILPTILPHYLWNETWSLCILGSLTRYVLNLNFTWLVNSAAHMYGNRPYNKYIRPTENWMVAFVAMGEGWHNYHHTFPYDYRAAELGGYKLNVTTLFLDIFAKIGWAYDLKTPSLELIKNIAENNGDASHSVYGSKHLLEGH